MSGLHASQTKTDQWIEVKLPLDKFQATNFGRLVREMPGQWNRWTKTPWDSSWATRRPSRANLQLWFCPPVTVQLGKSLHCPIRAVQS